MKDFLALVGPVITLIIGMLIARGTGDSARKRLETYAEQIEKSETLELKNQRKLLVNLYNDALATLAVRERIQVTDRHAWSAGTVVAGLLVTVVGWGVVNMPNQEDAVRYWEGHPFWWPSGVQWGMLIAPLVASVMVAWQTLGRRNVLRVAQDVIATKVREGRDVKPGVTEKMVRGWAGGRGKKQRLGFSVSYSTFMLAIGMGVGMFTSHEPESVAGSVIVLTVVCGLFAILWGFSVENNSGEVDWYKVRTTIIRELGYEGGSSAMKLDSAEPNITPVRRMVGVGCVVLGVGFARLAHTLLK